MKRPLSVTVLSWIYIVMGTVGFIYHLKEFNLRDAFHDDTLWIEILRILAVVAGIFMLKAANWARWLAIAWIAFHVAISFYNGWQQVVMHSIFLALFVFFLTRPAVNVYFRRSPLSA
jgi:hypothetical protein